MNRASDSGVTARFESALGTVHKTRSKTPSDIIAGGAIFERLIGSKSAPIRGQFIFAEGEQYKDVHRSGLGIASELAAEMATAGHLVITVDLTGDELLSRAQHAKSHMSGSILDIGAVIDKSVDRMWEAMTASAREQCAIVITGLDHMAVGSDEQRGEILQELTQLAIDSNALIIAFSHHLTLPKHMHPSIHYRLEEGDTSIIGCVNQNTGKYTDFTIYACMCESPHRRVS